jgi:hypothetical protein
MARSRSTVTMRRICAAGALVVAGLATTAPAVSADAGCPTTAPVSDAVAGLSVNGFTVSSGTTPEQFTGSVLGVLNDGIAPGLDLIMAELDSPSLEKVNGIWAGMSGSPVYTDDGRLLGAVSYGLSGGPSLIAGITPADEMYAVLDEASAAAAAPATIPITSGLRSAAVASGAATESQVDGGLQRLRVPLAISGLSGARRENPTLMTHLATAGMIPYAAAAAPAPSTVTAGAPGTDIEPGSNLAAGLSYGDVSAIAMGTATAICGGNVVAFGHPFLFNGATAESMHGGDTVAVQNDSLFGNYKLTNPTAPIGTITEDRLAGIAGPLGPVPDSIPVTSSVSSEGRHRDGRTDVVFPDLLPDFSALHLLANVDRIFDQVGPGVATVRTVITGTRSDGSPWTFDRTDRSADRYDAGFGMVFPLYDQVATLQGTSLEHVHVSSVDVTTDVEPGYTNYRVGSVQQRAANGQWVTLGLRHPARLVAGARNHLRVNLHGYLGSGDVTVPLTFTVPAGTVGQQGGLFVSGGGSRVLRLFDGPGSTGAKTFDDLLASLQNAPRHDDLVADLAFGGAPTGKVPGPTMPVFTEHRQAQLDRVITGRRGLPAIVVAPSAPKPGYVAGSTWSLRNQLSAGAPSSVFSFPATGKPFMGDWDADGVATPAVYSNGAWTVRPTASAPDTVTVALGQTGDRPVVGDFNGDGKDDLGVVRAGEFDFRTSLSPTATTHVMTLPDGVTGTPVSGDWDGNGVDSLGIVSSGVWTLFRRNESGAASRQITLSGTGVPVTGDWNRDGRTGIGYYRNGVWQLRNSVSSGDPVRSFVFGVRGSRPVVAR